MHNTTTQITIRNVDPRLKQLIDMGAKRRNTSTNQFVLDVVEEAVDYKKVGKSGWRNHIGAIPSDGFDDTYFAKI